MNRGAFASSKTDEWETPWDLFGDLNKEFRFTLDVCATKANAKCRKFYTKKQDGLGSPWAGRVWMNPPYGRGIGAWMHKAHALRDSVDCIVCLVPARTDTGWWHDFTNGAEIRFIRGRLKFGKAKWNAPFPSALVIFRSRDF